MRRHANHFRRLKHFETSFATKGGLYGIWNMIIIYRSTLPTSPHPFEPWCVAAIKYQASIKLLASCTHATRPLYMLMCVCVNVFYLNISHTHCFYLRLMTRRTSSTKIWFLLVDIRAVYIAREKLYSRWVVSRYSPQSLTVGFSDFPTCCSLSCCELTQWNMNPPN